MLPFLPFLPFMEDRIMSLTEIQHNLMGDWDGTNLLRIPNFADSLSTSHLSVKPVVKRKFLIFTYSWSHEGASHEGFILLGYHKEQGIATAAWADSWHMSAKIMSCQGSIDQQGVITLSGSYEAPPGPDWDWRITITSNSGRELRITMHNLAPEGAEELAVRADYRRAF
jgi:Protein of unknown function (DUF1579)